MMALTGCRRRGQETRAERDPRRAPRVRTERERRGGIGCHRSKLPRIVQRVPILLQCETTSQNRGGKREQEKGTFLHGVAKAWSGRGRTAALPKNSKSDARNSKQTERSKLEIRNKPASRFEFRIFDFEFVSDFDIRDSNLWAKPTTAACETHFGRGGDGTRKKPGFLRDRTRIRLTMGVCGSLVRRILLRPCAAST
jgi:hypothetical protein